MDLIDFKEYLREEEKPAPRRISRTAHLTPEQQEELNRVRTERQAAEYEEMNRIYQDNLRRRRRRHYRRPSWGRGRVAPRNQGGDRSEGDEG